MALTFVDDSADGVDLGASATALRDITAGAILVWAYPTAYPPASFRYMYVSNQEAGSRTFDIGGSGGTLGPRFILDRDTSNLGIGATTANTPHSAVNTWNCWAATWNTAGADTDQHVYGGNLTNALTEVTTYALQTAGSGTVQTEDPTRNPVIGGLGTGFIRGFPGRIAVVMIFNRQPSLGELKAQQFNPHVVSGCVGYWNFWGTGTQPDFSGHGNNGTVTGATASAHVPLRAPFAVWDGWRGAFTARGKPWYAFAQQ